MHSRDHSATFTFSCRLSVTMYNIVCVKKTLSFFHPLFLSLSPCLPFTSLYISSLGSSIFTNFCIFCLSLSVSFVCLCHSIFSLTVYPLVLSFPSYLYVTFPISRYASFSHVVAPCLSLYLCVLSSLFLSLSLSLL